MYQRHQAGGGLGSILTDSVMEFHAGGGERSPLPHFHGLPEVCEEPTSPQEHEGLSFSSGRVSGLWRIFVVARYV